MDKQKEIFSTFWSTIEQIVQTPNHEPLEMSQFPLPQLDMSSVRVLIQDNATDSEHLIPLNGSLRYTNGWSSLYNSLSYSRLNVTSFIGSADDPVGKITHLVLGQIYIIEVDMSNPLDVPLFINNLHLHILPNDESSEGENVAKDLSDSIYSESLSFTLSPKEKKVVQLHVYTLKAGKYKVDSLQWSLYNDSQSAEDSKEAMNLHIDVDYKLELVGKKLHKTFEQRMNGTRKVEKCLEIEVVEDEPYLGFEIHSESETIYKDEILPVQFTLMNKGVTDIDKVILFTDLNSFYYDQNNSKEIESLTPSSSSPIDFDENTNVNYFSIIKNDMVLKPNESIKESALVHVPAVNNLSIKFLVLYCTRNNLYKVLRYEMNVCLSMIRIEKNRSIASLSCHVR